LNLKDKVMLFNKKVSAIKKYFDQNKKRKHLLTNFKNFDQKRKVSEMGIYFGTNEWDYNNILFLFT
jgi:hypothetical protein